MLTTQQPQTEQKSAGKEVAPQLWPPLMSQNYIFTEQGMWGMESYLEEDWKR